MPYSAISRFFCSSSAMSSVSRCVALSSVTCLAIARYFMIFISGSTRCFSEPSHRSHLYKTDQGRNGSFECELGLCCRLMSVIRHLLRGAEKGAPYYVGSFAISKLFISAATRNCPAFFIASIRFDPGGNFLAFPAPRTLWHPSRVYQHCPV
jgi:hypothetical protein